MSEAQRQNDDKPNEERNTVSALSTRALASETPGGAMRTDISETPLQTVAPGTGSQTPKSATNKRQRTTSVNSQRANDMESVSPSQSLRLKTGGLEKLRQHVRTESPSQSQSQRNSITPMQSLRNSISSSPSGRSNSITPTTVSRHPSLTRKDSVKMFADTARVGQQQKRMALQGKLMKLKSDKRKQSFLKEGGMKNLMMAPTIINIFKSQQTPFVKFRRVARAVKLLIQVCHVCKSLLEDSVSQEAWFALFDNLAAAAALTTDEKKGRAFVTYVPNENRELEQLSFDVAEYMRHKNAEDYLTDDIRNIMKQRPGTRTDEQLTEVVRCMKNICKAFNEYPPDIQKQICQMSFYDKYHRNRVILRRGLAPDGIYFLLSGELIEKPEGRKQPEEIEAGQKFGEDELICGSSRRATVMSKDVVEILFLHRFDYRVIFNMSSDTCDPKNLDVCRTDAVFQHFPMQKLVENPGTWSVLRYKYGRLIVKDSNDIEWIYVIKSGEARVLKHLEPGRVDVKARRKKIQQAMEDQSSYHKKKKILDFIADGNGRKSCYAASNYHPGPRRLTIAEDLTSPNKYSHAELRIRSQSAVPSQARSNMTHSAHSRARPMTTNPKSRHVELSVEEGKENNSNLANQNESDDSDADDVSTTSKISKTIAEVPPIPRCTISSPEGTERQAKMSKTKSASSRSSKRREDNESMALPPFVQIETLHPGHTFGLRSCLDHDERGPSVSLVSGDCEVLAINKKFFMKHCDDALISLIKLKAKAFPSQTELVDRLDANIQWEEFKQETLKDFLNHRVRVSK